MTIINPAHPMSFASSVTNVKPPHIDANSEGTDLKRPVSSAQAADPSLNHRSEGTSIASDRGTNVDIFV